MLCPLHDINPWILEQKNFLLVLYWILFVPTSRPVFTHGPPGPRPRPRAANFQGRHIKKIEIEVWYVGKKRLSMREKFKGDLY